MSALKYLSLTDLVEAKTYTRKMISRIQSTLSGHEEKLKLIDHYIDLKKNPRKMTVAEIERELGHKVEIVSSNQEEGGGES
jgi:adenylosuccinate synthase